MYLVNVIIEHPMRHLDMSFTYLSVESLSSGIRVHVPFGTQKLVGFVQSVSLSDLDEAALKKRDGIEYRYIIDVIDAQPIITTELEKLSLWLSKMTFAPLVSCLKTMLPPSLKPSSHAKITKKSIKTIRFVNMPPELTSRQKQYLERLRESGTERLKDANVSRSVLKALEEKKAIVIEDTEILRTVQTMSISDRIPILNEDQENVLNQLFKLDNKKPFLLFGITGSGKTEIYLQASKKMLEMNKQVLMLVPEISLTPRMVALFQSRFSNDVAILHSRLSDGERYDEYRRILNGEVKIVVGARSAVFAPLDHIGLIILDEEHDNSYKQNNTPRYHTRDVALWRAKYHQAKLILGSASPSIESYAKAKKGTYHLLTLKKRATQMRLPDFEIIDMAKEAKRGNFGVFSRSFEKSLNECLNAGKQAIILVNRRGYATYLLCRSCGHVPKCPHCDVSLTYHKKENVLRCHYCGYEIPYVSECPECKEQMFSYKGMGTEQMQEAIVAHFPKAQVIRYDMDTTKTKHGHEKLLQAFERHEGNILLGTQMIAKGLDFEDVTFVGVLDGDSALNIPDYRSAERTFQLLLQVAGRAGRHQDEGKVVIQTYNPSHYAVRFGAMQDYESFYEQEIKSRQLGMYPPFCYLLSILFYDCDEAAVKQCAQQFARFLMMKNQEAKILGPAPAVISRINNQYRYRILVKYRQSSQLFEEIHQAIHNYHGKVKIDVDVNPYSQL